MAPNLYRLFASGNPLPANFLNQLQAYLSTHISANLTLTLVNNTTIQVTAGAGDDLRSIGIDGLYREIEATISASVPGTPAAGSLDVYVTTGANSFTVTGGGEVDNTDYSFYLKITVPPATPSGAGTEAFYRRIATLTWDGSKITAILPLAKLTGPHAPQHAAGQADAVTPAAIAAADRVHAPQHARGGSDTIPGLPPIGACIPYGGDGDPAGGDYLLADGRLIDRATAAGAAYFGVVGHKYNLGVDPGSNKVRIQDKRGRTSVGADNMSTAQGAAGRLPNSNRTAGSNGGAERHGHTVSSHTHGIGNDGDHNHFLNINSGVPSQGFGAAGGAHSVGDTSHFHGVVGNTANAGTHSHGGGTGGSAPGTDQQSSLQPYEVDNWIVRVL